MAPLTERLRQDMQSALRAGQKAQLSILRMALAAVTQREIDTRQTLDDAAVFAVLEKMIKQGRDASIQYRDAGREDLAAKETGEIELLRSYLPKPLSDAELASLIVDVIDTTGASGLKDMGKVMGGIKVRAAGRVDLGAASKQVREILAAD